MYEGISSFKSVTLEMPYEFVSWWTAHLDPLLPEPSRSNVRENGLRVKVDSVTQFFDESKKSIFPSIDEGSLRGESLVCIIEISGIYYFQEMYGFIVRAHQVVMKQQQLLVEEEPKLSGFAFL